jgi:TolA-binding protein
MKRATALVLSLAITTSAFAGEVGAAQSTSPGTRTTSHRKAKPAPKEDLAAEMQELRSLLQQQQQQIDQLKQIVQQRDQALTQAQQQASQAQSSASEAGSKADAANSAAAQSNEAVTALKTDLTDVKANATTAALSMQEDQKTVNDVRGEVKALSRIKFSGDLRLRFEPFFGGGAETAPAPQNRYRERFRLRFNMNSKITDDFSAGLSLASGDLGDPVSTNSTLTGFYTRKPIAIDKAFAVYQPHNFKNLTVTGGKFGYTWLRTEMTWDNDLSPEGVSESLAWDWKDKVLSHFAVVGYQTPILEVGGGTDTYMTGGQIQTGWSFTPKVKFIADAAYYDFANPDAIAQNQTISNIPSNGPATQGTSTGLGGTFPFSVSSQTNNVGVINGKRVFASKFGLFDAIARLDIDTGAKRWPVYALIDFVQNTRACANVGAFIAAGVAAPTCDSRQRQGFWTELKAGQTKNPGDVLLGYTFVRIERDAVLSAFNFSDLRQPTNVIEHRMEAAYQLQPHVQLAFTGLFGRAIVTSQSLTPERWLKRLQFDTIFTF